MKKASPEKNTFFHASTCYFYLNRAGKIISNDRFYEMDHEKMMQNMGNNAKVNGILPQSSSIRSENVGKIYSAWNFGIIATYCWNEGWRK